MKGYLVVLGTLFLLQAGCQPRGDREGYAEKLPNIVILIADDLGYGDLGCYGGTAQTPHLDRLASQGVRFTDFYAAAPNCSPSRVGLLTGRSPSKVGMYNYLAENHPMHLRAEEITIAEMAKMNNYRTGHFGKWHVSCLPQNPDLNQPQPDDQGFDYSFGTANNARPSHLNPSNFIRNGNEVGATDGYSCDLVAREALEWLDDLPSRDAPFLLYVAFHEPHKKVASPPELVKKYSHLPPLDAEYFANIENMDGAVGKILETLSSDSANNNTIIIFASDNGSYRTGSNGPLLGGKSFVYEGGIRVPGIITWKDKIRPKQVIEEPVGLVDIMPTLCDLMQVQHPNARLLDGVNLMPLLQGSDFSRVKPLSWFFYRTTPEMAMRIGDYSILGRNEDATRHTHSTSQPDMDHIKNITLDKFELYNLKNDIGQKRNINYSTLDMGPRYKQQILQRLVEIQNVGPFWKDLPPAKGVMKLKSEWRQLHPTGFSN